MTPQRAVILVGNPANPYSRAIRIGRTLLARGYTVEIAATFEQVGLTPGDQYQLYIDPQSKLVRRWDYMPSPDKNTTGTWDEYKPFGPLTLSTEHRMGNRRIFFTDVAVASE